MVVSDNGASAEGGPTGTTNETQFFNNAPEPLEDSLARIDELGGPTTFNHYPWGWTWAGNTPFRRWKRETYRGGVLRPVPGPLARGIKARGEVRTQYAHIIDMVPTVLDAARDRAAGHHPRRHPGAAPRRQLRPHLRRPRRGRPPPDPVLRDVRPPRHRPRRLARGLPLAGPVVRRGRQALRHADHGRESSATWTPTLGALPRRRGLRRDPRPRRPAPRQAHRDDRAVVRRSRQVRRAADRRQRPRSG